MPEQPTIIVQNTNQQNNDGCLDGCGVGCALLVLGTVLLGAFGLTVAAMAGDYGLGAQVAAWVLTPLALIAAGLLTFVWLDKRYGWGYFGEGGGPPPNTVRAEDLAGDASNYGLAKEPRPAPGRPPPRGRQLPHPDDEILSPRRGVNQSVNLPRPPKQEKPPQGQFDVYERLRGLKAMFDEGHITLEEYEAKKAELVKLL